MDIYFCGIGGVFFLISGRSTHSGCPRVLVGWLGEWGGGMLIMFDIAIVGSLNEAGEEDYVNFILGSVRLQCDM